MGDEGLRRGDLAGAVLDTVTNRSVGPERESCESTNNQSTAHHINYSWHHVPVPVVSELNIKMK